MVCRIQLSRRRGWRKPADAVVVSRPSVFRNPFKIVRPMRTTGWQVEGFGQAWPFATEATARDFAIDAFAAWLSAPAQGWLRDAARSRLRGRRVACWCRLDQRCHGDVLAAIALTAAEETEVCGAASQTFMATADLPARRA